MQFVFFFVLSHIGFGRSVVAVGEPGAFDCGFLVVGCTCGPAVGLEVTDVEETFIAHRPGEVARGPGRRAKVLYI